MKVMKDRDEEAFSDVRTREDNLIYSGGSMLGLGGLLFVCGILTHCMCTMTDRAAEQCNDIVPIEPVSFTYRPYIG